MFRLFRFVAKPQFRLLTRSHKAPLILTPLFNRYSNFTTKTLFNSSSASFSAPNFSKGPESQFIQDVDSINLALDTSLALYRTLIEKYINSQDFADFTEEDLENLLKAFLEVGQGVSKIPSRESDSLKYCQDALVFAKTVGIIEGQTLESINEHMGIVLCMLKRFDEALLYFERAIEIFRKNDVDLQGSLFSYYLQGCCYFRIGNPDKAEECFKQALTGIEENRNPDLKNYYHSVLALYVYEGLAYVNFRKNKLEEAHKYVKYHCERSSDCYGEKHVESLTLFRDYAYSLFSIRKFDEALFYAKKLSSSVNENYDALSFQVLQGLVLVGQIYTKLNDFGNTSANFKQVLDILEDSSSTKGFDISSLLAAKSSLNEGNIQRVEEILDQVFKALRSKHGKDIFSGSHLASNYVANTEERWKEANF